MQPSHNDRILALLCSVLDAHSAVLFLPAGMQGRDNVKEYAIASAFSLGNKLNFNCSIPEGRGLVGWILRNKELLLVSNFDQNQNNLGYYIDGEEHTVKAFMGCALPGGAGVLCVDSKRQYSFSEKDQKLLHLFSHLVAQLQTENEEAQSHQLVVRYFNALRTVYALRRSHSRWAEFLRNFLDLMTTMTGFSYGLLCTRDADGESYSVEGESSVLLHKAGQNAPSFPITNGVVGWVFRNSQPVMADGLAGGADAPLVGRSLDIPQFQTVLAVPLVIQRKTRGVLCLAHDTPREVEEATSDFVRMASEHLALFLENLYIKCRLRDLHRQTHPEAAPSPPE